MTTFHYTDFSDNFTSEVVDSFFYNDKTKELVVVVGNDESAYKYTGIPSHVHSAFKNSVSKGYFYNTLIKRQYGPAAYLGGIYDLSLIDANGNSDTSATTFPLAAQPAAVGTPKGLKTTDQTKVSSSVLAFPVKTDENEVIFSDAKSTTVVFNLGGNDATTNFDDKITVKDAVAEISKIADMLGLGKALVIKSVTVNFE